MIFFKNGYHPFLGIWTAIGCIVFSVLTLILLTYINARVVADKEKFERTCRDLENNTLGSQIEAHFIFNTLNAISAFCKTDPVQADLTIVTFASYLRSYLSLITCRENIPFQSELDLVEDYLTIQQKRFGDEFQFVFDTNYDKFKLPPFSVYTIVENSVTHGIRKHLYGGTITITTKKEGDFVTIIVADNGTGFDTAILETTKSVGLANTKRRMKLMCNATITTESVIGAGTTTTIRIPI